MLSQRVALVIGIDQYESDAIPDLRFAAQDAQAIATVLDASAQGDFDRVTLMSGALSRADFWSAFRQATADLQPEDTFLLYVASHGTLAWDHRRPALYLIPSDATLDAPGSSAISLARLEQQVAALPARHRIVILDACYNTDNLGRSQVGSRLVGQRPRALDTGYPSTLPPRGPNEVEIWLFAAARYQAAWEDEALGHGVYTFYLLEALAGAGDTDQDGRIDAQEAHAWAVTQTEAHTGGHQSPQRRELSVAEERIYLVDRAASPDLLDGDQALLSPPPTGSRRNLGLSGRSQLSVGTSLSLAALSETAPVVAPWQLQEQLWWRPSPSAAHVWLGLASRQSIGQGVLEDLRGTYTAELQAAWLWPYRAISLGPFLGEGLILRWWSTPERRIELGQALTTGAMAWQALTPKVGMTVQLHLNAYPLQGQAPAIQPGGTWMLSWTP